MISFDNFDIDDGSPIYMQIIQYIKQGIAAGTIQDRDEMPSRRVLSALLGVNPNTVQKAYRMLEEENIIQSHAGAKSYICIDEDMVSRIHSQLIHSHVKAIVNAMKQMGITKAEALGFIGELWE